MHCDVTRREKVQGPVDGSEPFVVSAQPTQGAGNAEEQDRVSAGVEARSGAESQEPFRALLQVLAQPQPVKQNVQRLGVLPCLREYLVHQCQALGTGLAQQREGVQGAAVAIQ